MARDKAGRITQKQETVAGTTSNYAYTYDTMGRLRTVKKDGTLVEEYQYNQNGTRIGETNTLRGISGRTFAYSDEDHLLKAGDITYQYDADGFLVTKTKGTEVTEYAYSSRGELLQVQLPDGKMIEYLHDPMGRRIAKKVNDTITEKYLWQGLTQLLAVYDGSNNLLIRFEYADERMPVAMAYGGSMYYLTYDQVGSLRVVSDGSGNAVKKIDYDSFGNIIADSAPSFTIPLGFAGGLHDRDTGLIRFGFRDYDSDIGRWTAKDPIGFAGGDTDLFGYCMNDPTNWVDSYGLQYSQEIARAIPRLAPLWAVAFAEPSPVGEIVMATATLGYAAWLLYEAQEGEGDKVKDTACPKVDALNDYPANPDEWNPPEGWKETPAGEKTGGRHRQWRGPNDELRRWDREGRHGGKERGPHYHDPRYPDRHIPPNR